MTQNKTFEQIENTRQSLGISKAEMCRKLKVCRKCYTNWQNGTTPKKKSAIKRLQKLMRMVN